MEGCLFLRHSTYSIVSSVRVVLVWFPACFGFVHDPLRTNKSVIFDIVLNGISNRLLIVAVSSPDIQRFTIFFRILSSKGRPCLLKLIITILKIVLQIVFQNVIRNVLLNLAGNFTKVVR